MSFILFLTAYFNLNFLLFFGFLGLTIGRIIFHRFYQLSAVTELRWHYFILSTILFFSVIHPFLPRQKVFSPVAKVWSASSRPAQKVKTHSLDQKGYLSFSSTSSANMLPTQKVGLILVSIGTIWILLGACFFANGFLRLQHIQKKSFLVRKIHNVHIYINDQILVPFSYAWLKEANVVMPSTLLFNSDDYKMALLHEIQHHRQNDTFWVYVLWGTKWLCALNPALYFWNRWIMEIQEFACDETLVDQGKVDSQAYACCLVEVAQNAFAQKYVPDCATGFLFMNERKLLNRRVEKMFLQSSKQVNRTMQIFIGVILVSIMGTATYASTGLIQDRRVTMDQARAMTKNIQAGTSFPVVVNDLVLKQLNRYIGTPEGREFMKNALSRMENYRSIVVQQQKKYDVPEELLAIPLIESGYQNLPEAQNSQWPAWNAAGIWQFIRSTAKNFGLKVDQQQDERLNVKMETDAAMRYLQANYLRFNDWQLAVLAYNMGETAVQKGIDTIGSRDVWTLIRNGYEGDKDYLAKVVASILIMKNPESVQN